MTHIHIDRLDGSSPVQATGTIDGRWAFYFRGRHGRWQFVAGPRELTVDVFDRHYPKHLIEVQLGFEQDDRVLVLQGDDDEQGYLDDEVARTMIDVCVQQFVAWIRTQAS